MLELKEKIKSAVDSTVKYIFLTSDKLIIELSYINKDDGKDIICVPTQTSCVMKCKFCHITDICDQLVHRNILSDEIVEATEIVYKDLDLHKNLRTLLISYMGCGEPLLNIKELVDSMCAIRKQYKREGVPLVRFAVATSLPKAGILNFFKLTNEIYNSNLLVKIHLSLHYTMDLLRGEWMPNALNIIPSLTALDFYRKLTKNSVEIHYALIEGINDTEQDAILLTEFLKDKDIPIKFLFYNEKPTINFHASAKDKLKTFKRYFNKYNIFSEYYVPPGLDIGASCGQFLMDYYLKYNLKK